MMRIYDQYLGWKSMMHIFVWSISRMNIFVWSISKMTKAVVFGQVNKLAEFCFGSKLISVCSQNMRNIVKHDHILFEMGYPNVRIDLASWWLESMTLSVVLKKKINSMIYFLLRVNLYISISTYHKSLVDVCIA